ncbi:hypothetical protein [Paenibacillus sp. yr247]|uniref:Lhr family helicase n=1 Tax=Paenibacillus sp. yr247 TaxID=1761880 RepID=UPI0011401921|nr:hypothetical protein [Paenibacillus sp. yr247]
MCRSKLGKKYDLVHIPSSLPLRAQVKHWQHYCLVWTDGEGISSFTYLAHMPLRRKPTDRADVPGMDLLREIIEDLQGFFLPVSHWESILFPTRQLSYRKQDLDTLCSSGEIVWIGRKEPKEKEGRIAFFLAESSTLFEPCLAIVNHRPASHPELLRLLQEKGAIFLSKLGIETGRPPSSLLEELFQLVWDGQAANDQFAPLRLHAAGISKKQDKFKSGLGRWYSLDTLLSPAFDKQSSAMQWTHHLLARFGIITKDLVSGLCPFPWEAIQTALRQLEEWGLVVRGFFITDLHALQFATREFIALLHQHAANTPESQQKFNLLSAADPANPFGLLLPWPEVTGISFSRKSGNYLALKGNQ